MAIAITAGNKGTATEKLSDTSLTLTPSASLAAGTYGLLSVVIDNTGTAEGETNHLSATDSQGHTWVKLREQTEANTAAETGVTVAVFLARLTAGLTTSNTITITLTAAATAKGAGLNELTCAAGFDIVLSAGGANGSNGVAATSYSVALSGLTNVPGLYVGLAASEGEAAGDVTKDTAYTAALASYGSGTAGIGPSNVIATTSTLANTSTGDTFDHATVNAADRATILVRLEEQAQAGGAFTIDAGPGSYAMTGLASTVPADRLIASLAGTYALTGLAASPLAGYSLNAALGNYGLSGTAAELLAGRALNAAPGAYDISGFAADLIAARALSADTGVYAVTGQDAALVAARVLGLDPGAYVITGIPAELALAGVFALVADAGAYTVSGLPAAVVAGRVIDAASGSFLLSGVAAELLVVAGIVLVADPGVFLLSGVDAGLLTEKLIAVVPGSYLVSGADATLVFGIPEALVWPEAHAPYFGENALGRILSPDRPSVR